MQLRTAFDATYSHMYEMLRHAAHIIDSMLSLVTGDDVPCDAFDISPYILSLIPEPVDYFMHCMKTPDCRTRCLEEYSVFEEAKLQLQTAGTHLGLRREMEVPIQSQLFRTDDIAQERHRPPFLIQDAIELSALSCNSVCNNVQTGLTNRCLLLNCSPSSLRLVYHYAA